MRQEKRISAAYADWSLGPFERLNNAKPILGPGDSSFMCPLLGKVEWEKLGIFNPATLVKDGMVFCLYRSVGPEGFITGVSRIGLGWSDDGLNFSRYPVPVLYPDKDPWQELELGSGVQDPRVVETEDGAYVLTYAVFDGACCTMVIATSRDLFHWKKHGPAFTGKYRDFWTKAGAIVCRQGSEKLIATRINGKYWMYWGEAEIFTATSDDLIHWEPVEMEVDANKRVKLEDGIWRDDKWIPGHYVLKPVLSPRKGRFDSILVEPGPAAILRGEGVLLIYNGCNADEPDLPSGAYSVGQALFDSADPTTVIGRTSQPFLYPEYPFEIEGTMPNVCFANGLVFFEGRWFLYYGAGDRYVGVCATNS
jgi:beta-1,2-mannosidase